MTGPETNQKAGQKAGKKTPPKWIGPASEYGPLILFAIAYWVGDLMLATKVVIGATLVAVALSVIVAGKLPWMPVVTAVIVTVFGGLTIFLDDEVFIKMKPTIVQVLFAGVLFGALLFGRLPLKKVMGGGLSLPDAAWRSLSVRFALFFIVMAGLNEVVWRTQSTDFWVTFKLAGILGLTFAFVMCQVPFINRHSIAPDQTDKSDPPGA